MRKTLVLVPTSFERRNLDSLLQPAIQQCGGTLRLCGFGPVAAAARTSQLIAADRPEHVLLVGIAGAIGNCLTVGTAWSFDEVVCYGVGVGTGDAFTVAGELGWHQWAGEDDSLKPPATAESDLLPLATCPAKPEVRQQNPPLQLLTCCAGSNCQNDVELRSRCFPKAIAEDMEGYGVALACSLANVPLTIVRGISNVAGDRDKSRWQVERALDAAADLAVRLIADSSLPS